MTRRPMSGAGIALALIASTASALASCNFIVGAGDYSVGDAETDSPTQGEMDSTGGQPDMGLPDEGGGQPDVAGGGLDVGSDRSDVGDDTNDATRGAMDGSVDAPRDVRNDSPIDAVTGGDAGDGGGHTDALDAADVVDAAADGGHALLDANDGAAEAETAPSCGQGLPVGESDFQKLVSTCLLAVSCDPDFFNVSMSQCISYDYLESIGSIACLSTIQDCAGFYSCEGRRYPTLAECPTGSTSVSCDATNNLAIDCSAGVVKSCSKYGGTCGTYIDGTGNVAVGCQVVDSCIPGGTGDQCSAGNKVYSCALSGVGYGRDCTTIGATCVANPTDGTSCYYNGPACNDGGADTCVGGALSTCTLEGTELNFNCARAGGSCAIDPTGAAYCLAPGCSTGQTCSESCGADGHTMTVCVGNAPYTIDCTQYPPFKACDQLLDSSGNPFAFCD